MGAAFSFKKVDSFMGGLPLRNKISLHLTKRKASFDKNLLQDEDMKSRYTLNHNWCSIRDATIIGSACSKFSALKFSVHSPRQLNAGT